MVAIDLTYFIRAKDESRTAVTSAERTLKGFGESVKKLNVMQLAMFGGAAFAVKGMVDAYMKEEIATRKLQASIGDASGELVKFAEARMQVTRFGEEDTINAMSMIANYTKETEKIKEVIKWAQDLAEVKGMDLSAATFMLTKSIFTESNALGRLGINIGDVHGASAKFEAVQRKVAELMGGRAVQAMDTASGKLIIMENNVHKIKETMGGIILEGIQPFIKGLNSLARLFEELPRPMQQFIVTIGLLAAALKMLQVSLGPGGWVILALISLAPIILDNAKKWKTASFEVDKYTESLKGASKAMLELERSKLNEEIAALEGELIKTTNTGWQFAAAILAGGGAGVTFAQGMYQPLEDVSRQLDVLILKRKMLDEMIVGGKKPPKGIEEEPDTSAKLASAEQLKFYNEMSEMYLDNFNKKKQLNKSEYDDFITGLNASLGAEAEYYNQRQDLITQSVVSFNEGKQQELQASIDANKTLIETEAAMRAEAYLTDEQMEIQRLADSMNVNSEYFSQSKSAQDAFQKGVMAIKKKYNTLESQMWDQNLKSMGQNAINTLGNMAGNAISAGMMRSFGEIKSGFGRAMADMLSMFISTIVEMTVRWLAFKALTSMFGAGFFFSRGTISVPAYSSGTTSIPYYSKGTTGIPYHLRAMSEGGIVNNYHPQSTMQKMIYAAGGMQAKGSDTIPAMLTPGEAVIPPAQTRKNLPAISQIIAGQTPTSKQSSGGDNYNLTFKIDAMDGESVERVINTNSFRKSIVDLIADNKINLKVQNNQVVANR